VGSASRSVKLGNPTSPKSGVNRTHELPGSARVRAIPTQEIPLLTYPTIGA